MFLRQAPPFLRALQHSDLQSMSSSVHRTFEYFISDVLSKNSVLSGLLSRKAAPCRVFFNTCLQFYPRSAPVFSDSIIWTGKCNWSAPLRKHYLIVPRLWLIAPICGSDDRRDRVFFFDRWLIIVLWKSDPKQQKDYGREKSQTQLTNSYTQIHLLSAINHGTASKANPTLFIGSFLLWGDGLLSQICSFCWVLVAFTPTKDIASLKSLRERRWAYLH